MCLEWKLVFWMDFTDGLEFVTFAALDETSNVSDASLFR